VGIAKPFKRTCRQFVDGSYAEGGRSGYIEHPKFANSAQQYIRAFLLIQKDLLELFDYVEPSEVNLKCYSYRIHELHTRACIEIEANCRAILTENGYVRGGNWNMGDDYRKLNLTHRLSSYRVKFPLWHGQENVRIPFSSWTGTGPLVWYQAYNQTKHDRHEQFEQANFDNLLSAISGLIAVLSSQFYTRDFSPPEYLVAERPDEWEVAIGNYFLILFPSDWPDADRYDFDWHKLQRDVDPFQLLFSPSI
jgi:hypothetical protein